MNLAGLIGLARRDLLVHVRAPARSVARHKWLDAEGVACQRQGELAFFVYGFAKSGRENLRRDELTTYRLLADEYLLLDAAGLQAMRATGAIIEVKCDDQAMQE